MAESAKEKSIAQLLLEAASQDVAACTLLASAPGMGAGVGKNSGRKHSPQ